jgi:CRISPR-associated RAMP protein (TIGR02581 family)
MTSPRFPSHAAFESVLRFPYRLTCRTGLHIGAGKSADLVGSDLPVLRDAAGRPLVPGSSLRGVLRAAVAALCGPLRLDAAVRRAPLATGTGDAELDQLHAQWNGLGLVDRLFGCIGGKDGLTYASRVQISDAVAGGEALAVELRDGVGIDRDTRTARREGGVKFDLEVVPAGTTFHGQVRLLNGEDFEVGVVAQALWMLDEGFVLLGGKSARGLGWVEVAVGTPRRVTAADILAGSAQGDPERAADFGPVGERLAPFLAALRAFAASAPPPEPGDSTAPATAA